MQMPTVSRMVHYQSYGTPNGEYTPQPRAAIVTAVDQTYSKETHEFAGTMPPVDLCVINPTGLFFNQNVPYSDVPKPGHWNWPPRS